MAKKKKKRVPIKMDLAALRRRCKSSITSIFDWLESEGGKIEGRKGYQHGFLDRGSKVLAVAHLDFVGSKVWFDVAKVSGQHWVMCPSLDDRLGVYTILDFLPSVGIEVDILLTENEERGMSTAKDFTTRKKYNWIVEFDRKGTDVVTYCYTWPKGVLEEYFKKGFGSYSDIADLDWMGCKAMNVGVGYHNEHTDYSFFVVEEWASQMRKFLRFYRDKKNTYYKHTFAPRYYYRSTSYYGSDYDLDTVGTAPKSTAKPASVKKDEDTKIYTPSELANMDQFKMRSCQCCGYELSPAEDKFCFVCAQTEPTHGEKQGKLIDPSDCEYCKDYGYPGWVVELVKTGKQDERENEIWVACPNCNPNADKLW
jgi:hypothetical protein